MHKVAGHIGVWQSSAGIKAGRQSAVGSQATAVDCREDNQSGPEDINCCRSTKLRRDDLVRAGKKKLYQL